MRKKPHFYAVESRLGTRNNPNGTEESSEGVEKAHEAILTDEFRNDFPDSKVHTYRFSDPKDVSEDDYFDTIARESVAYCDLVNETLDLENEIPVAIGGDHSISFATLLSSLKRHRKDLSHLTVPFSVTQFDSHFDYSNPIQSPSGNFHGMWGRPFNKCNFGIRSIDDLVKSVKGSIRNWVFVGDLENEPYFESWEIDHANKNGFKVCGKLEDGNGFYETGAEFSEPLRRYHSVRGRNHITFDIDVFSEDYAPATGITGEWGLSSWDVDQYIRSTMGGSQGGIYGIDLVEVNPRKDGAEKTIALAQHVLKSYLIEYYNFEHCQKIAITKGLI